MIPDRHSDYLFVYGLLRKEFKNEMALPLAKMGVFIGEGLVAGELFDTGDFPALVLSATGNSFANGDVYQLAGQDILKILDEFEGIGAQNLPPYEYARRIAKVYLNDHALDCWIYEYQWPVEGMCKISSGDYRLWKEGEKGRVE